MPEIPVCVFSSKSSIETDFFRSLQPPQAKLRPRLLVPLQSVLGLKALCTLASTQVCLSLQRSDICSR